MRLYALFLAALFVLALTGCSPLTDTQKTKATAICARAGLSADFDNIGSASCDIPLASIK